MLYKRKRKIGEILLQQGLLSAEQVQEILAEQSQGTLQGTESKRARFGGIAVRRRLITLEELYEALAEQYGLRLASPEELSPEPDALRLMPPDIATAYRIMPLYVRNDVLTVAIQDASSVNDLEDLKHQLGVSGIQAVLASPQAVFEAALDKGLDEETEAPLGDEAREMLRTVRQQAEEITSKAMDKLREMLRPVEEAGISPCEFQELLEMGFDMERIIQLIEQLKSKRWLFGKELMQAIREIGWQENRGYPPEASTN